MYDSWKEKAEKFSKKLHDKFKVEIESRDIKTLRELETVLYNKILELEKLKELLIKEGKIKQDEYIIPLEGYNIIHERIAILRGDLEEQTDTSWTDFYNSQPVEKKILSKSWLPYFDDLIDNTNLYLDVDLIDLKFPKDQNQKIIHLIYSYLTRNEHKFIEVSKEEFERHFIDNGLPFKKIRWNKSTVALKTLFNLLSPPADEEKVGGIITYPLLKDTEQNKKINELICRHFINKKEKEYNPDQFNGTSKKTYNFKTHKPFPELAKKIKQLLEEFEKGSTTKK